MNGPTMNQADTESILAILSTHDLSPHDMRVALAKFPNPHIIQMRRNAAVIAAVTDQVISEALENAITSLRGEIPDQAPSR